MDPYPSRLCGLCENIFKGKLPKSGQWLPHHNRVDLLAASVRGCFICRTIVKSCERHELPPQLGERFEYILYYYYKDRLQQSGLRYLSLRPYLSRDGGWTFYHVASNYEIDKGKLVNFYKPPADPLESELPSRWMKECIRNHAQCQPHNLSHRPTRLLEIIDSKRLRLVESSTRPTGPYVSFSHCWGDQVTLMLKAENLKQFCTELQVEELPKKYQEAISFSARLGIYFIWIDSMCIIQDSHQDWQREAITMKNVYGSSVLNMCSAAASDNSGVSFCGRDPTILEPLVLTSSWHSQPDINLCLAYDGLVEDKEASPLRKRAWVFQEWYLSPRSLILDNSQLWWHCRQKVACEQYPDRYPYEEGFIGWKDDKAKGDLYWPDVELWWRCVEAYAMTHLTYESDRLIAFAGVAQTFCQSRKISTEYLAGLWRSHLPQTLCWEIDNTNVRSTRGPEYTAPSWTWPSLTGPVGLRYNLQLPGKEFASLESVWLNYANKDHVTGVVEGGYIRLRGHLIGPLKLDHQYSPDVDPSGRMFPRLDGHYLPKITDERNIEAWDGLLYPDEMIQEPVDKGVFVLSYLDNLTPGLCEDGIIDNASRKTVRLNEAKGRYFCLPIVKKSLKPWKDGYRELYSLALFQPAHQHAVFHRIGIIIFREEIKDEQIQGYARTTITIL